VSQSNIPLSETEVQNIKQIISTFNDSSLNYLDLELGDLKIKISKDSLTGNAFEHSNATVSLNKVNQSTHSALQIEAPTPVVHNSKGVLDDVNASLANGQVAIKSPLVGRYYSQAEPGAKKYVEIGTKVKADSTVALIEAMKMFNAVPAGFNGEITKICVSDGELVEYGQVLFHIKVYSN